MNIIKELKKLNVWVKCLLMVCLILLLLGLVWPKEFHVLRLNLSKENFYEGMENNEAVFVMFYAPWCGYCKKAMPEWDKLQKDYKKCKIIKVDCDKNKDMAKLHDIKSYPTIKFLPNGLSSTDDSEEYDGNRTESDFIKFLNQHVSADPSEMPYQAANLTSNVPPYRAGQGPLTTSFVARNTGLE
jgi:protein disulfide-isomerase-like protein